MIEFKDRLADIINDNYSGSDVINRKLNLFVREYLTDKNTLSVIVKEAENKLHEFTGIINYLNKLKKQKTISSLDNFTSHFEQSFVERDKNLTQIAKSLKDHTSIFTISNSSTVLKILLELKNFNSDLLVTVTESRPICEGRKLAKILTDNHIKTRLITDAAASLYIRECDCVLLGADSILKTGEIINKTGSYAAALLAKESDVPVIVVASKSKINEKKDYKFSVKNSQEIWSYEHPLLEKENIYFDRLPMNLVNKLLTF